MDLDQLRKLADLAIEKNLAEIEIEQHGVTVRIRRPEAHVVAASVAAGAAAPVAASAGEVAVDSVSEYADAHMIRSPMVGTFYRSSSPDDSPYVQVGDVVHKGDVLCIVEAMKLMNEVKSEFDGKITDISVGNAEAVEFGQTIFLVEPV